MENREFAIAAIAILAVVVAAQMGLVDLSGVPGLGSIFSHPGIKVAIVGHSTAALRALLESQVYRTQGIYYVADLDPTVILSGSLNSYDVVILRGEKYCEIGARRAITDFVKSGRGLIVVADACTRMRSDQNVLGWEIGIGGLGDVMPVKHSGNTTDMAAGSFTLRITDQTHAIASGISIYQNFTGLVSTARPASTSKIIALVAPLDKNASMLYGITESTSPLFGKVVYYAYDPDLTSREMFLNTLLYMKGAKG